MEACTHANHKSAEPQHTPVESSSFSSSTGGLQQRCGCRAVHASKVWREAGALDHRFMEGQNSCSLLYLAPEVVHGLPCGEKVRPHTTRPSP